ncbi:hypothetical protein [Nocardioides sp. LS1]|uniref:hypothetical protein n=1 Tax=Nocardioides sp. LS1 TaxID=1027620 RepID=UPI000F6288E8|nr:hypothetical protein [Nocardioides sp. LS1]GCD91070.1 hypothetical protein NLS1_30760 [Nocardioides sp. LS1]
MHSRLSGLALAVTLAAATLAAGCESHDSKPAPAATSTSSASSDARAAPAVELAGSAGVGTYCTALGKRDGDYLWSGTQFTAHADATLEKAGPANLGNVRVVGTWLVEDSTDDGAFVPWPQGQRFVDKHGPRMPDSGASLAAGTTYRLVVRLRPDIGPLPGVVNGFDVTWSTEDGGGATLTDPSVLQFERIDKDC